MASLPRSRILHSYPKTLEINKEEMEKWIKNGAQLTLGVNKLLNPTDYPNKKKVVKAKKD
jgi:ribosomal protein S16